MRLSSNQLIFWPYCWNKLNCPFVTTWLVMLLLVLGARAITRRLVVDGRSPVSRWQSGLEILVAAVRQQIREVGLDQPDY